MVIATYVKRNMRRGRSRTGENRVRGWQEKERIARKINSPGLVEEQVLLKGNAQSLDVKALKATLPEKHRRSVPQCSHSNGARSRSDAASNDSASTPGTRLIHTKSGCPQVDRAKTILKDTIQTFVMPENKARLQQAVYEASQLPPEQQAMARMQKLVPLVTEIAGSKLSEYGLPNVMIGVMQLQSVAQQDSLVAEGVRILTSASMGNPIDDGQLVSTWLHLATVNSFARRLTTCSVSGNDHKSLKPHMPFAAEPNLQCQSSLFSFRHLPLDNH